MGTKSSEYQKQRMREVICKPIYKYDIKENFIEQYASATEAAKLNGFKSGSHISSVCTGNRKIAYGFKWAHIKKDNKVEIQAKVGE